MTSINETVASMVGRELAQLTLWRRYGIERSERREDLDARREPGVFSFDREMRLIRQTVDEYLAEGRVNRAEEYMKEKQRYLAEQGYYVRKLNQAYFAFHGTYAESPTSVSPAAEQLHAIRRRSPSLKDFVQLVSRVTTPAELARLAEAQR
jgi:hypothetical protein